MSTKELDSLERIPRRRWPLFGFTALLALAALGTATWPNVKVLVERIAARPSSPGRDSSQTIVAEPVNADAANAAPTNGLPVNRTATNRIAIDGTAIDGTAIEVVADTSPESAVAPRRPRHSAVARKSHSAPLRGYAWSLSANALVRIAPEDSGNQGPADVPPSPGQ